MGKQICVINALYENNDVELLTLSLWGKPVLYYPLNAVVHSGIFEEIIFLADSDFIIATAKKYFPDLIVQKKRPLFDFGQRIMEIDASAVMLTPETIVNGIGCSGNVRSVIKRTLPTVDCGESSFNMICHSSYDYSGTFIAYSIGDFESEDWYDYSLSQTEGIIIKSVNDFEVALVLKNKENKVDVLKKMILSRIKEKRELFQNRIHNTICLVGHSQLDQWTIDSILGKKVINCGISGISSKEYYDYILRTGGLNCASDLYLVMHGTNDIVLDFSDDEIIEHISKTFDYIIHNNPKAKIFFVKCLHTNGRLERKNSRIDALNCKIETNLPEGIRKIDVDVFDDEYGNLKSEYTIDGLHLSNEGYRLLEILVEKAIQEME